jgi:hypothetical protein
MWAHRRRTRLDLSDIAVDTVRPAIGGGEPDPGAIAALPPTTAAIVLPLSLWRNEIDTAN